MLMSGFSVNYNEWKIRVKFISGFSVNMCMLISGFSVNLALLVSLCTCFAISLET